MTSLRDQANAIARSLSHYRPVAATPVDGNDRIIFVFDIIPHESLPWTKGIEVEAVTASRDTVSLLMEDWKRGVLHAIATNSPSPVVRRAIAVHGIKAVKKALQPWHP